MLSAYGKFLALVRESFVDVLLNQLHYESDLILAKSSSHSVGSETVSGHTQNVIGGGIYTFGQVAMMLAMTCVRQIDGTVYARVDLND